jgi:hypothetical protein
MHSEIGREYGNSKCGINQGIDDNAEEAMSKQDRLFPKKLLTSMQRRKQADPIPRATSNSHNTTASQAGDHFVHLGSCL